MKRTVTFGEIMLRLKTPEHMRILQTDAFEASYGGAEANVAVSLAVLKDPVSFCDETAGKSCWHSSLK